MITGIIKYINPGTIEIKIKNCLVDILRVIVRDPISLRPLIYSIRVGNIFVEI